jgi:two-component SAPR family response regulator
LGHGYRLTGEFDRALGLFEQARNLADRGGLESQVTLSGASIGVVYLEMDRTANGLVELERATKTLREAGSDLDLGRVLFWLARGYYSSGQTSSARERLVEMMRIAKRLGYRPFSLAEGRRWIDFLAWASSQLTSDQRLKHWLQEMRAAVSVASSSVATEPVAVPRLEVRAFGTGRTLRDSRLLTTSDWGGSAIGRELFFYLLEYSPQSRDEIGATFWPDLSAGRMTSSFHAAKYKARRALGVEFVIYDNEHYQIDPELGIWYDVIEFTRLWNSAHQRRSDGSQKLNELLQAVGLYTGDFLEDMYSNWVIERRRVYQRQYFDALAYIVQELMRRGQFDQALNQAGIGLTRDYYREDLHRAVINCLAHTGRQTEALVHFEVMARHFRLEIQAEPEPETANLVDRVRSHRLD